LRIRREPLSIVELDEEYEALAPATVREEPAGTANAVGTVGRGQRMHVTGAVAGMPWLRVTMPDGRSGFVYNERLRKLSNAEL
jgi:hypothetical protein